MTFVIGLLAGAILAGAYTIYMEYLRDDDDGWTL